MPEGSDRCKSNVVRRAKRLLSDYLYFHELFCSLCPPPVISIHYLMIAKELLRAAGKNHMESMRQVQP
jgi:hypothetical protein